MSSTLPQASRKAMAALALAGCFAMAAPATAQSEDARLRKIEAEVRALQRAVFPNGDGRFFTPEVVTPNAQQPNQRPTGTPSETAVTDILARLDALENQLSRLTARSEENANAIAQLEERLAGIEARPAAEPQVAAAQPSGTIPRPNQATPTPSPTPAPAAAQPSPQRVAAVQAIEKPATTDAGEDEYTYGFRLWEAKFFPEAQQQLKLFVDRYPRHERISFGRNLLGRAYLDGGDARTAATFFFDNYTKDPNGARAPDSLLYLAESMVVLKDTARACRALAEFGEKYPALATGRLKSQYDRNRGAVRCS
ncbi:MAG: tetratricopeptide repeat protein [Croceibacterium sp.]